jgi:hypothetical protein
MFTCFCEIFQVEYWVPGILDQYGFRASVKSTIVGGVFCENSEKKAEKYRPSVGSDCECYLTFLLTSQLFVLLCFSRAGRPEIKRIDYYCPSLCLQLLSKKAMFALFVPFVKRASSQRCSCAVSETLSGTWSRWGTQSFGNLYLICAELRKKKKGREACFQSAIQTFYVLFNHVFQSNVISPKTSYAAFFILNRDVFIFP